MAIRMICPDCKGTGEIEKEILFIKRTSACQACKGSGSKETTLKRKTAI
ncbi:hypothetical protein [Alteribacter natronophilus]|nr:hypothetical protein [Alteribacter natronophilus]